MARTATCQSTSVNVTAFAPGCSDQDRLAEGLEALEFEGTACVDYRVVSGQPVLFEINPRFGGSLCTDVTSCLDAHITALDRG